MNWLRLPSDRPSGEWTRWEWFCNRLDIWAGSVEMNHLFAMRRFVTRSWHPGWYWHSAVAHLAHRVMYMARKQWARP